MKRFVTTIQLEMVAHVCLNVHIVFAGPKLNFPTNDIWTHLPNPTTIADVLAGDQTNKQPLSSCVALPDCFIRNLHM